ncbi:MAG: hypothetical protein H0T62_02780 [Parachlamydiaceae bacterium]|nr:hypothetical protein [Parachlamydiaceae bacterium]
MQITVPLDDASLKTAVMAERLFHINLADDSQGQNLADVLDLLEQFSDESRSGLLQATKLLLSSKHSKEIQYLPHEIILNLECCIKVHSLLDDNDTELTADEEKALIALEKSGLGINKENELSVPLEEIRTITDDLLFKDKVRPSYFCIKEIKAEDLLKKFPKNQRMGMVKAVNKPIQT